VRISSSYQTVNWPSGKDRLQVDEAAKLLQPAYPKAPIAKENDSELRSELIKVTRERDILDEIIRMGRDGLIQLVHPTLGISHGMAAESDWFIGPEGFARFAGMVGITVVGDDGAQVAASGDTGEADKGPPTQNPPELRAANDDRIHRAITEAYDEAENRGEKPPNVKEIPAPVLQILKADGYVTSAARIERLAGEDRHKTRRGKIGVRVTTNVK